MTASIVSDRDTIDAVDFGGLAAALERRGNTLTGFKDFNLKAEARIWPWLSYTCRILSTAALNQVISVAIPVESIRCRIDFCWIDLCWICRTDFYFQTATRLDLMRSSAEFSLTRSGVPGDDRHLSRLRTRNATRKDRNPKRLTRNLKQSSLNPKPETKSPKPKTQNPRQ